MGYDASVVIVRGIVIENVEDKVLTPMLKKYFKHPPDYYDNLDMIEGMYNTSLSDYVGKYGNKWKIRANVNSWGKLQKPEVLISYMRTEYNVTRTNDGLVKLDTDDDETERNKFIQFCEKFSLPTASIGLYIYTVEG
jgi:hypothetical protein